MHFDPLLIQKFTSIDSSGKTKIQKTSQTEAIPDRNLLQKMLDSLPTLMQTAERKVIVKHGNVTLVSEPSKVITLIGRNYDYLKEWTKNISEDFITLELQEQLFLRSKYRTEISKNYRGCLWSKSTEKFKIFLKQFADFYWQD